MSKGTFYFICFILFDILVPAFVIIFWIVVIIMKATGYIN